MSSWTVTQRLCLVLGVLFLAHAIGGMIVNPDFSTGAAATRQTWLAMDWNGWHALSGILLWCTAIAAAFRPDYARLFAGVVVVTNLPVVVWMLFDSVPLGLFVLPTTADLVFHATIVVVFAAALLSDPRRRSVAATG